MLAFLIGGAGILYQIRDDTIPVDKMPMVTGLSPAKKSARGDDGMNVEVPVEEEMEEKTVISIEVIKIEVEAHQHLQANPKNLP